MKTYDPRTFKTIRKELGLTSEGLARECLVSRQTISAIENGKDQFKPMILLIGLVLEKKANERRQR